MRHVLLAVIITLALGTAIADEVSVTEFVSGTTISSSEMNQNFQNLVGESNENDGRLDGAEASIDTLESYFPADSTAMLSSGGWHTIAHLQCRQIEGGRCTGSYRQKGSAYFMVRWDAGSWHQTTVIYASSLFSKSSLKILHNQNFNSSNKPFLAARLLTGSVYAGALLQIQVSSDASSSPSSTSPFTARLMGRELEKESSDYGWIMTDWVADGAAIDSIEYSILTDELVRTIPDEVQYLADFSCTDEQFLEWNDSTDEWECADTASPSVGLTKVYVDSLGAVIASRDDGYPDVYNVKVDQSNRVFTCQNWKPSDPTCALSEGLYFEGANCSGDAWMSPRPTHEPANLVTGLNGLMFAPNSDSPNTEQVQLQSRTTKRTVGGQLLLNIECRGYGTLANPGDLVPAVETQLNDNLNAVPPIYLEWR